MSAIIILIACSLLVAVGFLIAFILSSRSGQFDDVETPAMRMLFDDTKPQSPKVTPALPNKKVSTSITPNPYK